MQKAEQTWQGHWRKDRSSTSGEKTSETGPSGADISASKAQARRRRLPLLPGELLTLFKRGGMKQLFGKKCAGPSARASGCRVEPVKKLFKISGGEGQSLELRTQRQVVGG